MHIEIPTCPTPLGGLASLPAAQAFICSLKSTAARLLHIPLLFQVQLLQNNISIYILELQWHHNSPEMTWEKLSYTRLLSSSNGASLSQSLPPPWTKPVQAHKYHEADEMFMMDVFLLYAKAQTCPS